ncbi:MAG: hypothetical protein SPE43_00135 [Ruminococcus sp.]|nr:hypothetical protein [Oscillospiraceae bacterium]MDY4412775.1 hypothetical protein [Ruminococcus sp.]
MMIYIIKNRISSSITRILLCGTIILKVLNKSYIMPSITPTAHDIRKICVCSVKEK